MAPFLNMFMFDIRCVLAEKPVGNTDISGLKLKGAHEDTRKRSVDTECPLQGRMFVNKRVLNKKVWIPAYFFFPFKMKFLFF